MDRPINPEANNVDRPINPEYDDAATEWDEAAGDVTVPDGGPFNPEPPDSDIHSAVADGVFSWPDFDRQRATAATTVPIDVRRFR